MNNKSIFFVIVLLIYALTSIILAQSSPLSPMEELGKNLFFDKISDPDWMACANCHSPKVGFTGPIPGINKHGAVYRGAVPKRFGNRKPPSAAYATFSPVFYYDSAESLFVGGNFWDGRATGEKLGNPAADQALGPFLNPVEQNNASKEAVLKQVAKSKYAGLWEIVWGEPISYATPGEIETNYDRIGLAIAEYEASSEVNPFSSKYDCYLQGMATLTMQEQWGLSLFDDPLKGNCAACHPSELGPNGEPPLFTDFSFDNLGAPKNPDNPFYDMDKVYLPNGDPINPLGDAWIDKGMGGFLATLDNSFFTNLGLDSTATVDGNYGKHKVPTLRNVDKRPGNGFPKAYLHNGVFKSLKEVVHFYNTRDVEPWPDPEVPENINTEELGDLGLSDEEEDAIIAFMGTLSDGFVAARSSRTEDVSNEKASLKVLGPNPFNPTTQIGYYLPEATMIELEVFNIRGQKVATLLSGRQAAGEHEVKFNAINFPSGVYLVRLHTGRQVSTRKVFLLK